jgi:hypothetical protein
MADVLGPVQIHCCGQWGRHAQNLKEADIKIRAVEFHYPFTRIEELRPLVDGSTVFIPYITLDHEENEFSTEVDYFHYLLSQTDNRHRFWFALSEDYPGAIVFAREYNF